LIGTVFDSEGQPVEVAPGRGDLRRSSVPVTMGGLQREVALIDRHMSFARLYATQPMLAGPVGWLLRQSTRVPLKTYQRTGTDSRERLQAEDHPVAAAVAKPWERGSRVGLVQSLLGPYLVHGNALAEVLLDRSGSLTFAPTDWRFANPIMLFRGSIAGWELDADDPATRRKSPASAVLHVATWSPFGPLGISPLQQLGVTIAIEDAAQRHQRESLRNGVRSSLAVQMSDSFLGLALSERQQLMDSLRADIDEIYAGPDNSGRPLLFPPGLEPKPAGQTAVEAQLIEQRVVTRQEGISVYGLTPGALGIVERGSELAEQRMQANTDGLAPPLLMIEAALNAQIIQGLLRMDDIYVEFDFAGVLRGDKLKEIEALRQSIGSALMTPNEGRTVLNLPKSDQEGMDSWFAPLNNWWPIGTPPTNPRGAKGSGENKQMGESAQGQASTSEEEAAKSAVAEPSPA
jgi:HK97 family phage portal protein